MRWHTKWEPLLRVSAVAVGFGAAFGLTRARSAAAEKSAYPTQAEINARLSPQPKTFLTPLDREFPEQLDQYVVRWNSNWDRMEGIGDSHSWVGKKGSRASRHYLLIRHGQYVETKNRDEKRLSELGRDQACLIGGRLQDLKYPYDILISSTMLRATETADLIAQYLPDVPRVEYNILNEGAPPDTPVPTPKNLQGREVYEFQDGARLEAAFREFIHRAHPTQERDSFSVIVCHGNVIRYFLCRALQQPPEAWLRMNIFHASLTWMTVAPDGQVFLSTFNDAGHLPPEKLSTNNRDTFLSTLRKRFGADVGKAEAVNKVAAQT